MKWLLIIYILFTSHDFSLILQINNIENNTIRILHFGDLMYDRDVSRKLDTMTGFQSHFSGLKQSIDKIQTMKKIDYIGFNLETPIVSDKKLCQKSGKAVKFCSKSEFLGEIKKIGFNIVNIANNHSMDGGVSAHTETIKQLQKYGLKSYGYIKHGKYLEKDYVYTGSKGNIKYAWHGFDFVLHKNLNGKYCDILKEYKRNSYLNIVNAHWGVEYQPKHSNYQEEIGKYLIDCGADLIIGHHPHVVQDIQYYKDKPIIYSLGNLLFDQYFSTGTKIGGYVLIEIFPGGKTLVHTGYVNAYAGMK